MIPRSPLLLAPVAALATLWAVPGAPSPAAFEVVYAVDRDGNPEFGQLEELVEAVRSGAAVRVGWELSLQLPGESEALALEHWTDAGFVTVWLGHVFAQLHDIYVQGPAAMSPGIHLEPEPHGWTAVVGTTGLLRAVTGGERSELRAPTRWAVQR